MDGTIVIEKRHETGMKVMNEPPSHSSPYHRINFYGTIKIRSNKDFFLMVLLGLK